MKVKAIVYTSNTGYTKEYAIMLSKATGLPAFSLAESKNNLAVGTEIVYLGWVMAGSVRGYNQAVRVYNVKTAVGVCLGTSGSQVDEVRKATGIADDVELFTIQGGFDMNKLKGFNKLVMKMVRKKLTKDIECKDQKTADDKFILDMLWNGGSAVSEKNLAVVIEHLSK